MERRRRRSSPTCPSGRRRGRRRSSERHVCGQVRSRRADRARRGGCAGRVPGPPRCRRRAAAAATSDTLRPGRSTSAVSVKRLADRHGAGELDRQPGELPGAGVGFDLLDGPGEQRARPGRRGSRRGSHGPRLISVATKRSPSRSNSAVTSGGRGRPGRPPRGGPASLRSSRGSATGSTTNLVVPTATNLSISGEQLVPALGHEHRRVGEVRPALGQAGEQHLGDRAVAVGDQRAVVVVVDRAAVLGGDLLDHLAAAGAVVGGDEARQPAVGQPADALELRRGDAAEPHVDVVLARLGQHAQLVVVEVRAVVGERLLGPCAAQHGERLVEDLGPLGALARRTPAARAGRRRRGRTPAAAARWTAGRAWPAPWPARSGCGRGGPSRSSRT